MELSLPSLLNVFFKGGTVLLIFNEVRGAILAVPVLYGMYQAGGTAMAIWLGFCSLGGIALSVVMPLFAARKIQAALQSSS